MRRGVKLLLLILVILLVAAGALFYKRIVDSTWDKNGMEDPNYTGGTEMLDGSRTYVDNGALLEVIAGVWESTDGRCGLTLRDDCGVTLALDGETVLEGEISFIYLLPDPWERTELWLDPSVFQTGDGSTSGEVSCFYHEAGDGSGTLVMELADGKTVEFRKTAD